MLSPCGHLQHSAPAAPLQAAVMEPEKLPGRSMNAHFQMLSMSRTANPADQVCRKQAGGETLLPSWKDNSAQYGAPRLLGKCSQYLRKHEGTGLVLYGAQRLWPQSILHPDLPWAGGGVLSVEHSVLHAVCQVVSS